jgi:hypothetical protein
MDDLGGALRIQEAEGALTWTVPDGWQQGRGAWGGLVVGACVTAVQMREVESRPVRAVTVQMAAPVMVGEQRVEVTEVRRGSAMTTWNVDIVDDRGAAVVHASVICGAARDLDVDRTTEWGCARMGDVPSWRAVPEVPIAPPEGPVFGPHVVFRPLVGRPGSAAEARTRGWVAFADGEPWNAARVLGLIDAWWPGALVASNRMRPLATVMFAATLLVDPVDLDAAQQLYYEGELTAGANGFTSELRRLWSPDGRLVVENLQSIVVIA